MALIRTNMSLVGSGGAGKTWTYFSPDAVATIQAADYFLAMYRDLNPGDRIFCRAVVGGAEVQFDLGVAVSTSVTVTCVKSASYT